MIDDQKFNSLIRGDFIRVRFGGAGTQTVIVSGWNARKRLVGHGWNNTRSRWGNVKVIPQTDTIDTNVTALPASVLPTGFGVGFAPKLL